MDDAVLGTAGGTTSADSGGFGDADDLWVDSLRTRRVRRRLSGRQMAYALVAVLLVAGLLPFAPGVPQAGAADPMVEQLPKGFMPIRINNNGQILGYETAGGATTLSIYDKGEFKPVGGSGSVQDFTDDGKVLMVSNGVVEIRSTTDVQTLPKPVRNGKEQSVWQAFGPTNSGRVLGLLGWDQDTETNTALYQGATPPSVITQLSTAMIMNHKGQIFGLLPDGKTPVILTNDTVSQVTGLSGKYYYPRKFTDDGYLLYGSEKGTSLWHDGKNSPIDPNHSAIAVNNSGVLLIETMIDKQYGAALRFPNNKVETIDSLVGANSAGLSKFGNSKDINDRCDVIGWAQSAENQWVPYVAHLNKCEANDFGGSFFRTDLGPPTIKKDEDAEVRLLIKNTSGQPMTNVKLLGVTAEETAFGGEVSVEQKGDGPPATLAAEGPGSQAFVDFTIKGVSAGKVMLTAKLSGTKPDGAATGTVESLFSIKEDDLIVNLTLDPPEYEVPEDGEFEPVDITATVSFTNATDKEMTNLRLLDLDVSRVFSGQELYVTYKSGINPDPIDPEVIVPSLAPGATSPEFKAIFTATDDGEVEFSAMARAKLGEAAEAVDVTKVRWKAKVKKFVEIKTTVTNPPDDELLDAGMPVSIDGTIENLTNNYEITLGPLWPMLEGNTGTMTLALDGPAPNPTFPVPVDPIVLKPGEKRTFQVRFTTNYSDPRTTGDNASGGTRAYARFEPWGQAIEVRSPGDETPPDVVDIRTYDEAKPGVGSSPGEAPDAQVKASPEDLFKRISLDDSIELPSRASTAVAAGILLGGAEGLVNAAIAVIYSIPDLLKMPYSILVAAYDYQTKVWESFTPEEKDQFLTETSFMVVSVLMRNVEFGMRDSKELYDAVYKQAGDYLTRTQNDWQTGDYLKTTKEYSSFLSEQIGSVVGPVVLSKMAKSAKAVAALEKWQTALNAKMAATFAQAKNVRYVDNVLPILQSLENGAEPTLTAIAKLWGVTPDEVAEYQRICKVIGCLANVRSRHVSSIEWIKKWGALLKPENLKIKTVSELDVMLGYDVNDLGSLVFRKPEILKNPLVGKTEAEIKAEIAARAAEFATSKGFQAGTTQHAEATQRLVDKVSEWKKYEKSYKQWNKRGWIDTSFNYEDNAVPRYKFDANGEVIGKLTSGETGNYKGFRLVEKNPGSGQEEYIVQMLDGKSGKWRRVTGDIDPVDFTYTDGSPLTPEDHARLMKMLQNSPIGAEHGYTSTFLGFKDPKTGNVIVKPGPELVKKQFKPNEPALQIGPDGPPRATRLDVENSRWNDPYDYNMRWVNGFVDAGTKRARGIPQALEANFEVQSLDAPAQIALPVRSKPFEPTVGRFVIKHGNKGDSAALIMGENGLLQNVMPDGTTKDSPLHTQAFSEGKKESITVAPQSVLQDDSTVQPDENNGAGGNPNTPPKAVRANSTAGIAGLRALRAARAATASLSAGSSTIRVSTGDGLAAGVTGFEVGQKIAIGTGTDNVELHKIAGIVDGLITLDSPLKSAHKPGEVVTMVVSAAGVAINPDKGVDPPEVVTPQNPDAGTPGTTVPGGSQTVVGGTTDTRTSAAGTQVKAASSSNGGVLAFTGFNAALLLLIGLALVAVGMAAQNLSSVGRASLLGRRRIR